MGVRYETQSLSSPEAQALEALHLREIARRYEVGEDESDPPEDPALFETSAGGCFRVVWLETDGGDSVPVAMGGIRSLAEGIAELKRMYVVEEARGRGIARELLERLEEDARALGYRELWLETGLPQFEAMAMYESAGYEPIESYGKYKEFDNVRCYSKSL